MGHCVTRSFLPILQFSTAINKKTDQILSNFHTGIGAAANASLEVEQLISCARTAITDTVTILHDSGREVILVSEMYDSLKFMTF